MTAPTPPAPAPTPTLLPAGSADDLAAALEAAINEIAQKVPQYTPEQIREALLQHYTPALRALTAARVAGSDHATALRHAVAVQRDGAIPRSAPHNRDAATITVLRGIQARAMALRASLTASASSSPRIGDSAEFYGFSLRMGD